MPSSTRQWIIAALTAQPLPGPMPISAIDIAACAEDEGVLLLLEAALHKHPQRSALGPELIAAIEQAARPALMAQLAMLAEQQRVFELLSKSGVEFIVMKGGALAHWLYDSPVLRVVTDLDILLPSRASLADLESVLRALNYAPVSGNAMAIESSFERAGGPYGRFIVDAHWQLFNSMQLRGIFSYTELRADTIALPGQPGVFGLSAVHALIHACGHRAISLPHPGIHGLQSANALRWLWDVHALAQRFSEPHWHQILVLSADKQLSALLHEALTTVKQTFGSPIPASVLMTFQKQSTSEVRQLRSFTHWRRYQWQEFMASSQHWNGRFQWLIHMACLDSASVQARYGSRGGRFGRYARRLLAAVRRAMQ
jgi:Uncharacterised nucleotidyltransferase